MVKWKEKNGDVEAVWSVPFTVWLKSPDTLVDELHREFVSFRFSLVFVFSELITDI